MSAPGFRLAQDGGSATQGAVAPLSAVELVPTLDAVAAQYSPRHAVIGDQQAVVTLDATARGQRLGAGGVSVRRRGIRYRAQDELDVIRRLDARVRFSGVIEQADEEVLLIGGAIISPRFR